MEKTVCELFAGVGGFRLGLERVGKDWDVLWATSGNLRARYNTLSNAIPADTVSISNNFSYEFLNAGLLWKGGEFYTEKVTPEQVEPGKLATVLEFDVDKKYYIPEEEVERWRYMKGAKREKRKSQTGHEYKYCEGAIAFPDPLDSPSRTVLTSEGKKNRSTHVIEDPVTKRLRLLTPLECERLNGFDDNWTDTGMPDSFRYFCMGNALVVGVIEKIGRYLDEIILKESGMRAWATI